MTASTDPRRGARRPRPEAPRDTRPAIFGCRGAKLDAEERAFFRDARPFGFILFARNVSTPGGVRALVSDLRDAVGWPAPVLIDQEGGRVARLRPPHWRAHPPVARLCDRVDRPRRGEPGARAAAPWAETTLWEALALRHRLIAAELTDLGIDVLCAPLLDLALEGADPIIGDRALGRDPAAIAARAEVICGALEAGGVTPVVKHIPGHGRATVDSHVALPRVGVDRAALEADFAPFRALRGQAAAMTAHVVYEAIDPAQPATLSPTVIQEVVRGAIGFDGLLMSDDLSMGALAAPELALGVGARAAGALDAGCDIALHCNGDRSEMLEILDAIGAMDAESLVRADAMFARRRAPEPFDRAAAERRLAVLEAEAAPPRVVGDAAMGAADG